MKFSKTKPVSFEEETMQTFEPLNNVKSIDFVYKVSKRGDFVNKKDFINKAYLLQNV
jgi:hypothetical protein